MHDFKFEVIHKSKKSNARVGRIYTPHGVIDTPNFVAVGTNGALKAVDNEMAKTIGIQLMFCNTYHLLLQPGPDIIHKAGGLHKFINRDMPIITDSGGFQIFSLAYGSVHNELKSKGLKKKSKTFIKSTEEGALFRSYRDGKLLKITPEDSISAQKKMAADIIISFDELLPYHIPFDDLKKSLDRTHRWEKRSLDFHIKNKNNQALYAVIHGGINKDLRKKSCDYLTSLDFEGFSIGGSIGKNKKEMIEILNFTMKHLPFDFPIHLLGIGDVPSLNLCMPLGIDTFDSSYPTKAARHGFLFTKNGGIKIKQSKYSEDFSKIEKDCTCWTCQNHHLAYLNHLFKAKELTAYSFASIHNLHFMVTLMQDFRQKILNDEI